MDDTNYSYDYSTTSAGPSAAVWLVWLVLVVVSLVASWKVYTKAGKPGWAAIVPIYNLYVLLQIVGRPAWWLLLMLVPLVNIVIAIILALDLAKAFGKSTVFAIVGLIIFAPIGYLMLAFGSAKYVGPAGSATPSSAPTAPPPAAPQAPVAPPPPSV